MLGGRLSFGESFFLQSLIVASLVIDLLSKQ